VSVRQLYRLCLAELQFPPGTIIDLARIESVASEILTTSRSLTSIAREHAFNHFSDMRRVFIRFVGMRPGLYRRTGPPPQRPVRRADWQKLPVAAPPER